MSTSASSRTTEVTPPQPARAGGTDAGTEPSGLGTRVGSELAGLGTRVGAELGADLGKELRESALLLGLMLVVLGLVAALASLALLLG